MPLTMTNYIRFYFAT